MYLPPWAEHKLTVPCHQPDPPQGSQAGKRLACRLLTLSLMTLMCVGLLQTDDADAKRKRKRSVEPPLRIASITLSPERYVPGNGSLDFNVEVIIPPGTDGRTVLEVSSLIGSPSMRHVRFLTDRKPLKAHRGKTSPGGSDSSDDQAQGEPAAGTLDEEAPRRVLVTLSWDGTNQYRQLVDGGRYEYVIRAKLLVSKSSRLSTWMVSWKEKGILEVKAPPVNTSESVDVEGTEDPTPDDAGLERQPE